MIRVWALYLDEPGRRFDLPYYTGKHIPLVKERMTPFGLREIQAERGVGGLLPGTPARARMLALLTFDSLEGLQAGLAAHGAEIMSDIPNYTDIAPDIQITELAG